MNIKQFPISDKTNDSLGASHTTNVCILLRPTTLRIRAAVVFMNCHFPFYYSLIPHAKAQFQYSHSHSTKFFYRLTYRNCTCREKISIKPIITNQINIFSTTSGNQSSKNQTAEWRAPTSQIRYLEKHT